jgi:MtN3 and saliva related transmembrane protein
MDLVALIGYVAGAFTTVAFLPQLVRALRTKSTGDLSFPMLVMMFSGVTLWSFYGLLVGALPIVVPNAVMAVLVVALMVLRLRYD